MTSSFRARTSAFALGSSVALVPIAFASPAFAAESYDCGGDPDVDVMGGGVCWYPINPTNPGQSSSGSFTAPAGVDTVTALLVGGGGGSFLDISEGYATAYGGGAGEVRLYESVPSTSPISYTVGGFGYYDYDDREPIDGGNSSITGYDPARGGKTATFEDVAKSGSQKNGAYNYGLTVSDGSLEVGGGGGSAGDALTSTTLPDAGKGGAGTTWESLNSPLFDLEVLAGYNNGGGIDVEDIPPIASGGTVFEGDGQKIPSVGDGGMIFFINDWEVTQAYSAMDGVVVFAWMDPNYDPSEDDGDRALPETGSAVQPLTIVGALASLFAGAVALTRRRERI